MYNKTYDIPVGQDTPYYILDENRLLHNLELIKSVSANAGVEIILAFKAYALWKTFPVFRRYIHFTTASSPYEARLAKDEFGSLAHTYSPAYETKTFREIMECSKSITFNSLTQYSNFYPLIKEWNASSANHKITVGLRINPERSEITTEIYNPCAPGTRFGIRVEGERLCMYLTRGGAPISTVWREIASLYALERRRGYILIYLAKNQVNILAEDAFTVGDAGGFCAFCAAFGVHVR